MHTNLNPTGVFLMVILMARGTQDPVLDAFEEPLPAGFSRVEFWSNEMYNVHPKKLRWNLKNGGLEDDFPLQLGDF